MGLLEMMGLQGSPVTGGAGKGPLSQILGIDATSPSFQAGLQMLANSMPSTERQSLFEGVPQAIQGAQTMQLRQQVAEQEAADREAEKQRRAELAKYAQSIAPPNLQSLAAADPESALRIIESMSGGGASDATFFGTPIWGVGPDGQPAFGQLNNRGEFQVTDTPEGFAFGKEPIRMDAGTHFVLLDPVTRQQIGTIPKNGDVPTGFQQAPEGGIMPMPNSDADRERIEADLQAQQRLAAADQRADIVIGAIDSALGQANWFTTGPVGSVGRALGATPMIDLEATINTVKSNIGFNELQQMREMSPTGGALGSVALQELDMLQSVLASLDPRQGDEQLRRNLETIKTLMERQKMYRQQAFEMRQQALGGGHQAPAASGGGQSGSGWSVIGVE